MLAGAELVGALYDEATIFPKGFDPEKAGMKKRAAQRKR